MTAAETSTARAVAVPGEPDRSAGRDLGNGSSCDVARATQSDQSRSRWWNWLEARWVSAPLAGVAAVATVTTVLTGCGHAGLAPVPNASRAGTAKTHVHRPSSAAGRATRVANDPGPTTPPSTTASTDPATAQPGDAADHNELDHLLLSASDLGAGYSATAPTAPHPLPCTPSLPAVDDQVHHVEAGRAAFRDVAAGTEVAEQIYVYSDHADAITHQHIDQTGLACSHGTIDGHGIDIAGPYRVDKQLNVALADSAQAWSLSNGQINAELFCVRIRGVIVQFSFTAAATVHPTLPVLHVMQTAITRILQHG